MLLQTAEIVYPSERAISAAAHAEKVPFIDAPLLGWGERSECFLQFSSALLLLLQVFGCFVVEQISFIFRGQGVI